MQSAIRSAALISIVTLGGQLLAFFTQVIAAASFGASVEMDSYLTATSLPTYVSTLLLGSLSYVFIPFFVSFRVNKSEAEAYDLASALLNNCVIILALITIGGIFFTDELLRFTAPGLSAGSLELGAKIALITWPTIVASGAFYVLMSICQAEKKFVWQAVVPLIGGVANLIIMWSFAHSMGVLSLAIGSLVAAFLQVVLLANVLINRGGYSFNLGWSNGALRQIRNLLLPLVLVAAVTKSTPLIDRYVASNLSAGSISYLNYATKIVALLAVLFSAGGSTVIFPKMAKDAARDDMVALGETLSLGVRLMWLVLAPVIAIGFFLAPSLVAVTLGHGQFGDGDVWAVARLLQVYLFAIAGMGMGAVTAKGFYVLRDTKSLAFFGVIETLAYAAYCLVLTNQIGVLGIAISGVIYFNVSIVWQILLLVHKLKFRKIQPFIYSSIKILVAAGFTGFCAFVITKLVSNSLLQLVTGSIVTAIVYYLVLTLFRSEELEMLIDTAKSRRFIAVSNDERRAL